MGAWLSVAAGTLHAPPSSVAVTPAARCRVPTPVQPGRLTLLLGTPGSGRSVLMKALAGRLGQEKTLKVGVWSRLLCCLLAAREEGLSSWLLCPPALPLLRPRCLFRTSQALLPTPLTAPMPPCLPPQVKYDELTYDGQGLDTFVPERTAVYVSQLDNHFGGLKGSGCRHETAMVASLWDAWDGCCWSAAAPHGRLYSCLCLA